MAYTKVTGALVGSLSDLDLTNVGDIQLDSISGDADTNTSITFSGSDVITIATGGSGRLTIGDGALSPVTDNQIDLGTSSLEFKDGYFDGTVTADAFAGPLTGDVTGDLTSGGITISGSGSTITDSSDLGIVSGGDLTLDVTGDIVLDADGGDWTFKDGGTAIGSLGNLNSGDFRIRSHVSDKDIFFTVNDAGTVREVARFDGSDYGKLQLGGVVANFGDLNVTGQNNGASQVDLYSSSGSGALGQANIIFSSDSSSDHLSMAEIRMEQPSGDEASRKGQIKFRVSDNGGPADAMLIENNKIITTYGDLKVTNDIIMLNNGRGISFAADTEDEVGAGSVGSETLHDYEEGTWTPANNGTAFATALGSYTKIGNRVFCQFKVVAGGGATSGDWSGLPFTIRNSSDLGIGGGNMTYHNNATGETYSISTENVNTTTWSIRHGSTQKQLSSGKQAWGAFQYLV